jgi:hypothetical protein
MGFIFKFPLLKTQDRKVIWIVKAISASEDSPSSIISQCGGNHSGGVEPKAKPPGVSDRELIAPE